MMSGQAQSTQRRRHDNVLMNEQQRCRYRVERPDSGELGNKQPPASYFSKGTGRQPNAGHEHFDKPHFGSVEFRHDDAFGQIGRTIQSHDNAPEQAPLLRVIVCAYRCGFRASRIRDDLWLRLVTIGESQAESLAHRVIHKVSAAAPPPTPAADGGQEAYRYCAVLPATS